MATIVGYLNSPTWRRVCSCGGPRRWAKVERATCSPDRDRQGDDGDEAVDRGVLLKTLVPEGASVRPGTTIAVIGGKVSRRGYDAGAGVGRQQRRERRRSGSCAEPEANRRPVRAALLRRSRASWRAAGVSLGASPAPARQTVTRRDIEAAIARAKPAAPRPRARHRPPRGRVAAAQSDAQGDRAPHGRGQARRAALLPDARRRRRGAEGASRAARA